MVEEGRSILVTGSQGFIGRHLMVRLRADGYEVMEWQEDVRGIIKCDVAVDVVVHLAAVTRHDSFITAPDQGYDVNVTGTLGVLNYCKKVGAACVLASTSAVYRPSQSYCLLSEESAAEPVLPYSTSKWLAENLCRQQSQDLGVPSVVLRLFNVYGPGQHPSFLVPYIVDCLRQGRRISLRMPEALRDFIYVDDVVDALVRASSFSAACFRVFNIGSGQATRVIDLVHLAEEIYGEAVGIDVVGPHTGERSAVVADITRASQELGWRPQHDVRAGLVAMMAALEAGASGPR